MADTRPTIGLHPPIFHLKIGKIWQGGAMGISVVKNLPPFSAVAFEVPGSWEIACGTVRYWDNSTRLVPKVYVYGKIAMLPALIREAYMRGRSDPIGLVKDWATIIETESSYFMAEWKVDEGTDERRNR